jgi:hypothetical protein
LFKTCCHSHTKSEHPLKSQYGTCERRDRSSVFVADFDGVDYECNEKSARYEQRWYEILKNRNTTNEFRKELCCVGLCIVTIFIRGVDIPGINGVVYVAEPVHIFIAVRVAVGDKDESKLEPLFAFNALTTNGMNVQTVGLCGISTRLLRLGFRSMSSRRALK